ncbi:MAG: 50S ribosomal protein L24 [Bacteroidia bacterium]|nr:50S ribosomal protein L24 [Bacteroidia bacterium]MDW8334486.1 50S ribosomal protein L24 [Bacteroidia bacterium]
MHVRSGDEVVVISGKNKGAKGRVLRVFPKKRKAIVEGVNLIKKHLRSQAQGTPGRIVERAAPLPVDKLMLIDPASGKPTRIGRKKTENGWVRYAKRSGKLLS